MLAPALLGALLAGCSAGPDYRAPHATPPTAFSILPATNSTASEALSSWWLQFDDAQLNNLVTLALATNHDLRIASARVMEARALHRQAKFDFLPSPRGTAGYTHSQYSQAFEPGVSRVNRDVELYDVGFDATWELDLFGRVRRSVEAARATVQVTEENRRFMQITLISEVARNYFELRGTQNELAVSRRNAGNQEETLKITQARLEGGRGTQLDVSRAEAQLNSTRASIPLLEAAVSRSIHRLSVLCGRPPGDFQSQLETPVPLRATPELLAIGNPETLLRRRPDIRAAERQLAAATARIGMETADLFPRITFNGRIGLEASSISGLAKNGSDTWSFGPAITWAALDYGHVRARMKAAGARADAELANYEQTILLALEETENALMDYNRELARRGFLQASEHASASAATLARERYENGATDFLTVLDSERVLLEAQDQLAQSQTRTATSLVAVYKALGGGWELGRPK